MTQVAICQPHYLPWLGYFEMIDRVDRFVLLDDVDFIKREWKNRNRIRKQAHSDDTKWLTVPIRREHQRHTPICAAQLSTDVDWRRRHLDAVSAVYRHTPFFSGTMAWLSNALEQPAQTLGALNGGLIRATCTQLGIETQIISASELQTNGRKTNKLIQIVQAVEGHHYLANNGSAVYLDVTDFESVGLDCTFQDYEHPKYAQFHRNQHVPWLSHLSIIDLMMNQGPTALAQLRHGRPTPERSVA